MVSPVLTGRITQDAAGASFVLGIGTRFIKELTAGSLLQEKISLALTDALRLAYGARYAAVPLDTRARALRAGATDLRAIGVTEDTLPDPEALARLVKLTIEVMRKAE